LGMIFEYIIDLPEHIPAMVTPDEDGNYIIYFNARATREQQAKAALHELKHIQKNHFSNYTKTVEELEREAMA
jgi:hypothetical protein